MALQEYPAELHQAIADYRARGQAEALRERAAWKKLTFEKVILFAGHGLLPDGETRHDHLKQVSKESLQKFAKALWEIREKLRGIGLFEDIYRLVDAVGREIDGINESGGLSVTVYDTAYAIAANQDIEPMEVHLHSNPGKGARALGLRPLPGRTTLLHSQLPDLLREFPAWQVEDILCHFITRRKKSSKR